MTQVREISTASGKYPVVIGSGLLRSVPRWLRHLQFSPKARLLGIVADQSVAERYAAEVEEALQEEGYQSVLMTFPSGEDSKSLRQLEGLATQASQAGLDRTSLLLTLGGGVAGDLGGFLAAVYMRGLPFVQLPTTLLAHDASVGGKVGVDHPLAKNLLGAFWPPKAVLYDVATLRTLSDEEWRNGLGELVKHGLLGDSALFEEIVSTAHALGPKFWRQVSQEQWTVWLARGIEVKARIVEQDERETGMRRLLNAGHTVGHAVEWASSYRLRHGEAVSIGLVAESRIALRLGMTSADFVYLLEASLAACGLPVTIPSDLTVERLMQAISRDKKKQGSALAMALPVAVGEVRIVEQIPIEVVQEVLTYG
ncbi:MAG: 3-dehydroquinate synthase [Firmicutes bacterium]|nr:3-dehydroquinate synthase [Bacillota bacterium]